MTFKSSVDNAESKSIIFFIAFVFFSKYFVTRKNCVMKYVIKCVNHEICDRIEINNKQVAFVTFIDFLSLTELTLHLEKNKRPRR